MKGITLTNSTKFAIVDDEDFEALNKLRWRITTNGYIVLSEGYPVTMHSVLVGTANGGETDHINRCRRDNRKSNLRLVSRGANQQNSTRQR